ncbi:SDR family NAD(P)-dependent oxidoreductase [Saccharomonospora sp. NPDC046836]|uniref:SDR family NAD(P)-dependent oxidoreductase n=1 Tax=Saccharomonospora sp. NPDC046836 TaxID=3156921 RepID=UPI0033FB8A03
MTRRDLPAHSAQPAPGTASTPHVAIVGMGIAVPGASTPDEFWALLNSGEPVFGEPGDRYRLQSFWHPDPAAADRTYARTSGYLTDLPADPAGWLRHCVEQAMAGVALRTEDRWSCVVGGFVDGNPAMEETALVETVADGMAGDRGEHEVDRLRAALRRRYHHARDQPSKVLPDRAVRGAVAGLLPTDADVLVVDAACASSLYALDLAVGDLLSGERTVACCGGYFAVTPRFNVMFAKLNGLSHTGRVRVFDDAADGTLFSDGAGALVLKTLDRALSDGDDILGVVAGTGTSSDGAGKSIYAPNPHGQRICLQRAWRAAGVGPGDIDWLLAHGTGTPAGDAAELSALTDLAVREGCPCTSTKSLVGHTGWGAGVVSVIHALLALRQGAIPGQRPLDHPSQRVRHAPVTVPTRPVAFPERVNGPRTVAVSAFGFGGANAHVVLRDQPAATQAGTTTWSAPHDPYVLVAWSAVLPGAPSRSEITDLLDGGLLGPEHQVFPPDEPLPGFAETKLPPFVLRAIDHGQRLGLRVAARFAEEHGELWESVRDTTGVVAAQLGPTRLSMDNLVRCYQTDLEGAFDGDDAKACAQFVSEVCDRVPATEEQTAPGTLPNVVAGRVAARHDLHGPTLAVDSGLTAVRLACRYLRGDTDLVLVLGVNANSGRDFAAFADVEPDRIAEGAFLIAISTQSTAQARGWPKLATIQPVDAHAEDTPRHRIDCAPESGPRYLGADGVVSVLRALRANQPAVIIPDSPRDGVALAVTPNAPTGPRRETTPFVRAFRAGGSVRVRTETPAVPPGSLVLAGSAQLANAMADQVRKAGARLVVADPAVPAAEAARSVTEPATDHLRVLVSLHDTPWPRPPDAALMRLHDLAFLAASAHRDRLRVGGSYAALVLDPFTGGRTHPHGGLFTGLLRALRRELADCLVYTLVSDAPTVAAGLAGLQAESALARGTPVARNRAGDREQEVLDPRPLVPSRGEVPLDASSVVVAVGGARGITAAVVREIARTAAPRIWLLGTTEITADAARGPAPALADVLASEPELGVPAAQQRLDHLRRVREAATTLAELRALCGDERVHYLRCDVTDPAAVRAAAERIHTTDGAVDLMINAAGVVNSAALSTKTLADFRATRDTKLLGYHHLKAAFSARPPGQWWNFGSNVSVLGMAGDADYTAANEFLALAAESEQDGQDGNEVTLCWPVWAETGLGASAISRAVQERLGMLSAISTEEGTAHAMAELTAPAPRRRSVYFLGAREIRCLGEDAPSAVNQSRWVSRLDPDHAAGENRWRLTPTPADRELLAAHLIRGRASAPGAVLLDFAAEIAAKTRPGLAVTAITDVRFDRYLRVTADGSLPPIWGAATPMHDDTADDQTEGVTRVRVEIGTVPRRTGQRLICAVAVVHLQPPGPRSRPAAPAPPTSRGTDSLDPYQDPRSPVALSGAFRALERPIARPLGGSATARLNGLLPPPGEGRNHLPVITLDCLFRVRAQTVDPDDTVTLAVGVPTAISRLDLYTDEDDSHLARTFGELTLLHHDGGDPAGGDLLALAPGGDVLLRVRGLRTHVLARFQPTAPRERRWHQC